MDFDDAKFKESYEMAEKLSYLFSDNKDGANLSSFGELGLMLNFLSVFNKKYQNKYERNRECLKALSPALNKRERVSLLNILSLMEMKNILMVMNERGKR